MSVLQIVELVAIAVLMIFHVISNFYNARCTCKLCTVTRQLLGKDDSSDSEDVVPADKYDDRAALFDSFIEWLETQKEK